MTKVGVWVICIAAAVVLAALGTWLLGLPLVRAEADERLTDRIQRFRARSSFWMFLVCVSLPAISTAAFDVSLFEPSLVPAVVTILIAGGIGSRLGGRAVRRRHFREGTTMGEEIGSILRNILALYGVWYVLLLLPFVVHTLPGLAGWGVALVAGVVLWFWGNRLVEAAIRLLDTEPVEPDRFADILEKSSAPRPDIYAFGSPRASLVNAFALPSLRQPAVLFTRTLLERLTPSQQRAIFAHELAHLEDFDRKTLQRWELLGLIVLALGVFAVPLLDQFAPGSTDVFLWFWFPILLGTTLVRAAGMQDRERFSDARAVELTGDPESLVEALEALHEANHLPRRLDAQAEAVSTHPSLARRIQAIRGTTAESAPLEAAEYVSRKSDRKLIVDDEGFLVDDLRVAPEALVEMRIVNRRLRLVTTDETVHKFPLREEDVARLRPQLDGLDTRLAPLRTNAWTLPVARLLHLATLFTLLLLLAGGYPVWAVFVLLGVAIAANVRPTRMRLRAYGAMTLFAGVHASLLGPVSLAVHNPIALLVLMLLGAALLWISVRGAFSGHGSNVRTGGALLALALVLALPPLWTFADGDVALRVHSFARHGIVVLLPLAAGVAVLLRRWYGVLLAAAFVAFLACGLRWFAVDVVKDPFARELPAASWTAMPYEPVRTFEIETPWGDPLPSPDGTAVMVETEAGVFDVYPERTRHRARQAIWLDDGGVALLAGRTVQRPGSGAKTPLPDWTGADGVRFDPRQGWWAVTSRRGSNRVSPVRNALREDTWPIRRRAGGWRVFGPPGYGLQLDSDLVPRASRRHWMHYAFRVTRIESRHEGRRILSAMPVHMVEPSNRDGALALVYTRNAMWLWNYRFEGAEFEPRFAVEYAEDWRWDGERYAARIDDELQVLHVREGKGVRIPLPDDVVRWGIRNRSIALQRGNQVDILQLPE